MIINMHAHLRKDDVKKDPIKGLVIIKGLSISEMEIDEYVKHCSDLGITKVCISCTTSLKSGKNEDVKEVLFKRYPDFFIGFGYVDIDGEKPEIVNKLFDEGFKGLKLICPLKNYNDKEYFSFYEKASQLNMPILFHTGWVSPMGDKDISCDRMQPIYLDTIARAFPELILIGAHLGNISYMWQAIEIITKVPNIYFDLTGGTIRNLPFSFLKTLFSVSAQPNLRTTEEIINKNIFKKIIYGSDNPKPEVLLEFYNNLMRLFDIDEETKKLVLGGTAAKILNIK
ncbi:MAG: amidohydrolase family protein [bacterium]